MAEQRDYWARFWQKRMTRRRVIQGAALGGAGLAAAAIIGCAEEERPTATPAPPAATPAAPLATPTPAVLTPKRGGTLRSYVASADLGGLDAIAFPGGGLALANSLPFWYNRLFRFKASAEDPSLNEKWILEPELATSHEVSADAVTWSFKIRQGVKWQNKPPMNGRDFTIEDAKFNIERHIAKAEGGASEVAQHTDQVQYPDKETVVFKLKAPYAEFVKLVGFTVYFYPTDVVQKEGDANKTAIGTGPFILERWDPPVGTFNVRNPDYWEKGVDGKSLPYVEALHALVYKDMATVLAQFRAGNLDVSFLNFAVDQMKDLQRSNPEIGWIVRPYWNQYNHAFSREHYAFKGQNLPPFNDVRVRRAISMAVDRKTLNDLIYGGLGVLSATTVPPSYAPYFLDSNKPEFGPNAKYAKFNPQEAKQLLQAAGYGGGFESDYYFNAGWAQGYKDEVEAIVSMLKDVGIKAKAQPVEFSNFIANFLRIKGWEGRTGMSYDTTSSTPDIHGWVWAKYSPDSTRNISGINDPDITPLVVKLRGLVKEEERVQVVHEIQRLAVGQAYYPGWLQWPRPVPVQPWVKNYAFHHSRGAGTESYTRLWIDKG